MKSKGLLVILVVSSWVLSACQSAQIPPAVTVAPSTNTPVPTSTPEPSPTPIQTLLSEKDGMTLVYVPAGEFTMGSNADDALAECQKSNTDCVREEFTSEEPPHSVMLPDFRIDQTEVTNAMYAKCVASGTCTKPIRANSFTHLSYYGNSEFDNYPVINVDWTMAKTYCEWAGRRLPTEAEWEKAARGEDGNIYPWGNTFDETAVNFCDINCTYNWANKSFNDGYADVAPVGNYPSGKSMYGAYDMAGNVWEWVNDWYDVYPGGNASASRDFGQKYRVMRGGAWYFVGYTVRSAYRGGFDPTYADSSTGFRCSRSLP